MNFIDSLADKKYELPLDGENSGVIYHSLHLGDFFTLEKLRIELKESLARNDKESFRLVIGKIIKLQTKKDFTELHLNKMLKSVIKIIRENYIEADAVFLVPPPVNTNPKDKSTKDEKIRWDYNGRVLAIWIDTFARYYHWTLEKILDLPLNAAIYLYQEILAQNQFIKEWQYSLTGSQLAYQYNENSKKSEFVPLPRPYWMDDKIDGAIKTQKLRRDMLPSGVVIDLSGMGVLSAHEQIPTEIPKETNTENTS